jgi:RNA polymerase sigma factor (sigma-70 family)
MAQEAAGWLRKPRRIQARWNTPWPETRELSERLREALSHLPQKQAEVFCLHALCGWSHREVGERLNMTENAVGVTIHRARQRLRELLGNGR